MVRYKVSKHKINEDTWVILWTNQYGEFCSEYFYNEDEANAFAGIS